jgi:4-amino-4-deoxy-L-arabinose transferase-like glycosyltransferase
VVSVIVIYKIVKRSFGSTAGLISALFLAVTPVFVAVSRINTIDNLLVMTLLFACWALLYAVEKGKLKYLILSLVIVGIGFNIKMLQAYMIIPAIYITYLIANNISVKKRIVNLIAGTVVLLIVSFAWVAAVDLTPSSKRPFVGSSTNNTVMELIVGHNGIERLGLGGSSTSGGGGQMKDGQMPPGMRDGSSANIQGQQGTGIPDTNSNSNNSVSGDNQNFQNPPNPPDGNSSGDGQHTQGNPFDVYNQGRPGNAPYGDKIGGQGRGNMQMPGGKGGGGGSNFGGSTQSGITRLFSNNGMSDQIIWLLPLALFGFAAAAIKEKMKFKFDNERKLSIVLWLMWLLPMFIYFSFTTGLFHPYYLTMIAPPIAALAGIGVVTMWQFYKDGGWK